MSLAQMDRYVAALPRGLASYPECQIKASVLRSFFERVELRPLVERLPDTLRDLVLSPPPPSMWLAEVHTTAIFMAAADTILPGDHFVDHAYRTNYALLDSTMYRVLFRLVGARRVLTKATESWSQFHRGSSLTARSFDERGGAAALRINAPAHHIPALLAEGYATALRAATEIAGGKQVECAVSRYEPSCIDLDVRWK